MPINSLYPGFVKLFYESNGHGHSMVIPCDPFQAVGGAWWLNQKDVVGGGLWTDLVTAFVTVWKPWLNNADSVTYGELWTLPSPTGDPVFRAANDFNIVGTSAVAAVPYGQISITFRADDGGLYRWLLLESIQPVNSRDDPPFLGVALNVSNYLIGTGSFVKARSGGWLVAPIRYVTKTNDKLREKFLLDV